MFGRRNQSMPTPDELRAAVKTARSEAGAAINECGAKWEVKPASGEGEDVWCAKEVAQHIIGADWFFTNSIAQACGAKALDRPTIDVSTPSAASASLESIGAADDKILGYVSEGDLSKTWETRLGTQSVEAMLQTLASHCRDHVAQIRSANA
jgi:hypothetical protein